MRAAIALVAAGGAFDRTSFECHDTGKPVAPYPRLSPTVTTGCGLATGTYSS